MTIDTSTAAAEDAATRATGASAKAENLKALAELSATADHQADHIRGIVAATMFSFTVSWAGFLYPLTFIFRRDSAVLTTGVVGSLITGDVIYWGGLMAGALVAALPPIVVYVFLMDYYVSGLTAGATKG